MSKYADVIKGAKDLLSKSYVYSNKVELKSTTSNGVTFTADATVSKPASSSIKAEFASGNFKVDKLSVGTDKKVNGEFSLVEAFPGTKLSFKASDASRAAGPDAISATVGVESKQDFGTFTVDVDALSAAADFSALFSAEGFLFGTAAKAAYTGGSVDFTDYNVLLGYKTKDFTVAAATENKFAKISASYHQIVSPTLTAAAVAKFPTAFKATPSAFDIEAGIAYKVASDTTVHGKVNQAGKIAVSYGQQVSPLTKITFAGEVDAANISSDDHKFGVVLNITA